MSTSADCRSKRRTNKCRSFCDGRIVFLRIVPARIACIFIGWICCRRFMSVNSNWFTQRQVMFSIAPQITLLRVAGLWNIIFLKAPEASFLVAENFWLRRVSSQLLPDNLTRVRRVGPVTRHTAILGVLSSQRTNEQGTSCRDLEIENVVLILLYQTVLDCSSPLFPPHAEVAFWSQPRSTAFDRDFST